jgi:ATP-dependent DNA helicase RecQ
MSKEIVTPLSIILDQADSFTLLLAPPAWGKSHLVFNLAKLGHTILYLAPLQAINAELAIKSRTFGVRAITVQSGHPLRGELGTSGSIIICGVEQFSVKTLEWMEHQSKKLLIVLDELHLFLSWGESFRPRLLEIYQELLLSSIPVLALSATINSRLLGEIGRDCALVDRDPIAINLGNMVLANPPAKEWAYHHTLRSQFDRRFHYHLLRGKTSTGTTLYFCRYRQEVVRLVNYYRSYGLRIIGCVGGEGREFQRKIAAAPYQYDCIFATTALSHGVNLPLISDIFISYHVDNPAIYLQMVGRGGRRGESYNLHQFNPTTHLKPTIKLGWVPILLVHLWIGLLLYLGCVAPFQPYVLHCHNRVK